MKLIVCLDERNGMMFGGRRQSRDGVVCKRIISLVGNNRLWMNNYSAKLFADYADMICVDDAFAERAAAEDFCFVENPDDVPSLNEVTQIVLFKWNRHYPADRFFTIDLKELPWKMAQTDDFTGKSHEKITMEIYVR